MFHEALKMQGRIGYREDMDEMIVYGGITKGNPQREYVEGVHVLKLSGTGAPRWEHHRFASGPGERSRHCACIVGGKMYVFGGACKGSALLDLWELDLVRMQWSLLNSHVCDDDTGSTSFWATLTHWPERNGLFLRLKRLGFLIDLTDPTRVVRLGGVTRSHSEHCEVRLPNGDIIVAGGSGREANWVSIYSVMPGSPALINLRNQSYLERGRSWAASAAWSDGGNFCFVYGGYRNQSALR